MGKSTAFTRNEPEGRSEIRRAVAGKRCRFAGVGLVTTVASVALVVSSVPVQAQGSSLQGSLAPSRPSPAVGIFFYPDIEGNPGNMVFYSRSLGGCEGLSESECVDRLTLAFVGPEVVTWKVERNPNDDPSDDVPAEYLLSLTPKKIGKTILCWVVEGDDPSCQTVRITRDPLLDDETGSLREAGITVPGGFPLSPGFRIHLFDDAIIKQVTSTDPSVIRPGNAKGLWFIDGVKPGRAKICIRYAGNTETSRRLTNCATMKVRSAGSG